MANQRNYKCSDVDMLLASQTIIKNLSLNLSELSIVRSNWTRSYVNNLEDKINDALVNHLGFDKKKEIREATVKLTSIQAPALRDLSFIKTQIEILFNKESKIILKKSGFDKYHRGAHKGDQESLIQLLFSFKGGMDSDLRSRLILRGITPELIDRIIRYANRLKEANISQETLNETTKTVSSGAIDLFNEIYDVVNSICKIASIFYQYDALKREQFNFSKVAGNMNAAKLVVEEELAV